MAAEIKEQQLKQQETEATKPNSINSSHPPTRNQTTITVLYSTHFKKNYYSVENCWVLHLELKKANDNKKRAIQSNRKRKRS